MVFCFREKPKACFVGIKHSFDCGIEFAKFSGCIMVSFWEVLYIIRWDDYGFLVTKEEACGFIKKLMNFGATEVSFVR